MHSKSFNLPFNHVKDVLDFTKGKLKVFSKYPLIFKMISDQEVIDEYGNPWNPRDHPRREDEGQTVRDEGLSYDRYGVAVNTEGFAKVYRLGPQIIYIVV